MPFGDVCNTHLHLSSISRKGDIVRNHCRKNLEKHRKKERNVGIRIVCK